MLTWNWFSGCL